MKRGSTGQRLMALGAVAATAGLLAACGSSSKPSTSATTVASGGSATTSAPSTGTAANLSGKSFSILGVWTGGEAAAFQAVINGFDQQTGAHGTFTAAAG